MSSYFYKFNQKRITKIFFESLFALIIIEHKISRGYLPSFVYSIHWFSNVAFGSAISDYLDKEEKIINEEYDILMKTSPFKK